MSDYRAFMSDENTQGLGTLALHAGQEVDPTTGSRAVPIYATTSYVFNNTDHAAALFGLSEFGNIYSRFTNPTVRFFEERLAAMEGGERCVATSSGMAAIMSTVLALLEAGDEIVASRSIFGSSVSLFTKYFGKLGNSRLADKESGRKLFPKLLFYFCYINLTYNSNGAKQK